MLQWLVFLLFKVDICYHKLCFSQNYRGYHRGKGGRSLHTKDNWSIAPSNRSMAKKEASFCDRGFSDLVILMLLLDASLRSQDMAGILASVVPYTDSSQFCSANLNRKSQKSPLRGILLFFLMDYLYLSMLHASRRDFPRLLVPLMFPLWSLSMYVLCPTTQPLLVQLPDLIHSGIFRSK